MILVSPWMWSENQRVPIIEQANWRRRIDNKSSSMRLRDVYLSPRAVPVQTWTGRNSDHR